MDFSLTFPSAILSHPLVVWFRYLGSFRGWRAGDDGALLIHLFSSLALHEHKHRMNGSAKRT